MAKKEIENVNTARYGDTTLNLMNLIKRKIKPANDNMSVIIPGRTKK